MIKIIISLVAVVLFILVIGFFAMRFLRADDDTEEFEDQPAERGRSGAAVPAAAPVPADQGWRDDGRRGAERVAPLASRAERGGYGYETAGSRVRADGRDGRDRRDDRARVDDRARLDDRVRDDRARDDWGRMPERAAGRPAP
jgi:hypothetical protein